MHIEKIEGIKSVDIQIEAAGFGVVNWNGPTRLRNHNFDPHKEQSDKNKRIIENHTLPKLRGFSPVARQGVNSETGEAFDILKTAAEIDPKKNSLYISQNCIRHFLFKDQAYDAQYKALKSASPDFDSVQKLLASETGLLRGYVLPESQFKRTSPLLIQDFEDTLGNGQYEQMGRAGERDANSIFSKTTFGETHYTSYASIDIEQLQFICLDKKFDNAAYYVETDGTHCSGDQIAEQITAYLVAISGDNECKATFGEYVRRGTIFNQPQQGILINDHGVDALVQLMVDKIKSLSIKQAKGYMSVTPDKCKVDFNDSSHMMRIAQPQYESDLSEKKAAPYAVYYAPNQA